MNINQQTKPKAAHQVKPEALCYRAFRAFLVALQDSWTWRQLAARLPIVRADLPALAVLITDDLAVGVVKAGGAARGNLPGVVSEIRAVLALDLDPVLQRVARACAADLCAMTLDSKPWRGTPALQAAERLTDALSSLNWTERFVIVSALLLGRDMDDIGRALHARMTNPADAAILHLEAALERMNRFYEVDRPEDGARWYVVETKGREEGTAKFHLERQRFEVYLPLRFCDEGAKSKHAPFFPRYLFVRMDPEERQWGSINSTSGVVQLVCRADGRPAPVASAMIERIRAWEREGAIPLVPRPVGSVKAGDAVRITAGALSGFDAIVQTSNDAKRSRLMLEFAEYPESRFKIVAHGAAQKVAVVR